MKKKVVVTGAAGFIGSYAVKGLLEKEYDVTAILYQRGNTDPGRQRNVYDISDKVNVITGDICGEDIIENVAGSIGKCDVFIHLAADLNIKGNDKTVLTNCLGTYHCVKLAEILGAKRFVYMSSIPVIGTPRILPVTEEHPVQPNTLYHVTKYSGEMIVSQAVSGSMKTVILRIPSPIGRGMSNNNYLSFLLQKCKRNEIIEVFGTGSRIQNYIDVRDIASAVLQSIYTPDSGVYLIAGKSSISNIELARLCKELTASESEIISGMREDSEESDRWIICTDKARQAFGFSPKYELKDTIQWIADDIII